MDFSKTKTSILIPARMESRRFPGKPLAPIEGIPMVVYCAKNAIETGLKVYVCTDSKEIKAVCRLYNVDAILTPECATGTDRVSVAVNEIETDYIINLQGDEPLISSSLLQEFIANLYIIKESDDIILNGIESINSEEALDINNVKCALVNKYCKIQYLSRKPLLNNIDYKNKAAYFKQLGLYAMSIKTLRKFASLPKGDLEQAEKVEVLRWLENGFKLRSCLLDAHTISVDTPEDLVKVIARIKANGSNP